MAKKSKKMKKKGYMAGGMPLGATPPMTQGAGNQMESEEERKKRMMRKSPGMKKGGMAKKGYMKGGMAKKGYAKGGKSEFPDLTGDGKVTQADILQGRGVNKKKGMQKGGMAKKGYANGGVAKKKAKPTKSKGKVRGAGIAKKGVRKCKMR